MNRPLGSSPLPPTVLHDIPLGGEARTLVRRGGSQAAEAHPPAASSSGKQSSVGSLLDPQDEGYQAGLKQGHQDGFTEGLEWGKKQGLEAGLAEGREAGAQEALRQIQSDREAVKLRIERLDQMLDAMPDQLKEQIAARLSSSEGDMVALCYTVVCRLLGDNWLGRDAVVHAVRQAVEQCCGSGSHSALAGLMSIHVHPRDLELLSGDPELAAWFKRQGAGDAAGRIPWVPDEQVRLGGCIVHSKHGSLDARFETQLAALHEIFSKGREGATSPGQSLGHEGEPA